MPDDLIHSTIGSPPERTETRSCPICAKAGQFVFQRNDGLLGIHPEMMHPLFHCASCDSYFGSPMPAGVLKDFYPQTYYDPKKPNRIRSVLGQLRVRNRARAAEWRAHHGRIPAVGGGRGALLQEMVRRGWEVAGMDWNLDNARAVSARLGIQVAGGADALRSFPDASFDVISMFHVLEHDERPLDLLAEVNRVLRPGGRLLVAVPNGRSAARALFRRHWCGFDMPRHRCTFTPNSLRSALQQSGFALERLSGRASDEAIDIFSSVNLLFATRPGATAPMRMGLALLVFCLLYPARALGFFSVMYGYAKKVR